MILEKSIIEKFVNFPRPDLRRSFFSLNGSWLLKFAKNEFDALSIISDIYSNDSTPENDKTWSEVNVPFCVESKSSKIGIDNKKNHIVYYKKVSVEKILSSTLVKYLQINFGAIDNYSKIFIDGKEVAESFVGYSPINISLKLDSLKKDYIEIAIYVYDGTSISSIHGNQSSINYLSNTNHKQVSGIWQPAWAEVTGEIFLKNYRHQFTDGVSNFYFKFSDQPENFFLTFSFDKNIQISAKDLWVKKDNGEFYITIKWDDYVKKLDYWSVNNPSLISFVVEVYNGLGICDRVESYIGFRTVSIFDDKILVNGFESFQKLVLYHGIFSDTIYTPQNRLQYFDDLLLIKEAGFNGIRVSEKIDDPALLFCADAIGLYVWQDFPQSQNFTNKTENHLSYLIEDIVERDFNHPSLIVWTIFYKSKGLFLKLGKKKICSILDYYLNFLKGLDKSRLVIENSCYYHWQGDIIDVSDLTKDSETYYEELKDRVFGVVSIYDMFADKFSSSRIHPEFIDIPPLFDKQPLVLGEFGAIDMNKDDIKIDEKKKLIEDKFMTVKKSNIFSGFCWFTFADYGDIKSGLWTIDRSPKFSVEFLKNILNNF